MTQTIEPPKEFLPAAGRKYLTEQELVDYVRISAASIRRLIRREMIPYIVIPLGDGKRRTIRFKVSAIDRWLEAMERRPLRRSRE